MQPITLATAMGCSLARATELAAPYEAAMRAADISTPNRAAMFAAQVGHESAGLVYMAEIETSNPSWSWDRTRYRGRGPIQLTWQSNYRKFGAWCAARGYITDPEMFVNRPELVEEPRWGLLAAAWYWLFGGPFPGRLNEFSDAGDLLMASRAINGNVPTPNGMPDRTTRWNRCRPLGVALLPGPATSSPDLAAGVGEVLAQLGPGHPDWRPLGRDEHGDPLTLRDAVGVIGREKAETGRLLRALAQQEGPTP